MASSPPAIETLQRLVDQVQVLSSVLETLTLRLLELEERLQVQERLVLEAGSQSLGPLAERRLADTEARLSGLEQLLANTAQPAQDAVASGAAEPGLELALFPSEALEHEVDSQVLAVSGEHGSEGTGRDGGAGADGVIVSLSEPEDDADSEEDWEIEDDWSDREALTA